MGQASHVPRRSTGRSGTVARSQWRGRTRCRLHGGDTPQGIASPHYRGKGYSRSIPAHLKDIYEAHFNDPDLLSLHKEIALCDTRIEDLLPVRASPDGPQAISCALHGFRDYLSVLVL